MPVEPSIAKQDQLWSDRSEVEVAELKPNLASIYQNEELPYILCPVLEPVTLGLVAPA